MTLNEAIIITSSELTKHISGLRNMEMNVGNWEKDKFYEPLR